MRWFVEKGRWIGRDKREIAPLLLCIHVAAASCDKGCSARSWLTGHSDGTKIIGHIKVLEWHEKYKSH